MSLFSLFLPAKFLNDVSRIADATTEQVAQTKRIADLFQAGAGSGENLDDIAAQVTQATTDLSSSTDTLKGAVDSNNS